MPESAKRTRPCDACRRRKTKCLTDPGESICVLCRFHNQNCIYESAPRSRKRTASQSGLNDTNVSKRSKTVRTRPGTGVEEYDTLPDGTLLKRTLGLQNLHHSHYIGPNDLLDVYGPEVNYATSCTSRSGTRIKIRYVHPAHAFRIVPDAATPGHSQEASTLDAIEEAVHGHGPELVRLYFRIVHPAFPILHQEVFLEKYARSYREFTPPLLAAVYLLASGYWSYSDALAMLPKPDLRPLKQLAWQSLQSTMARAKLSTIQACLLLAQHQSTDEQQYDNKSDRNAILPPVELAYQLGLHLDASDWDIPSWEIGLRRRLSWAVYMQDKWTALFKGRPSLIDGHAWSTRDLNVDDFPETTEDDAAGSSEVEKGRLVFMHMASLAVILSDVLDTIFAAQSQNALAMAPNKLLLLLESIKPLQLRLKAWFTELPESLRMDSAASMKLSSVGYLRLAYLTLESCVHRHLVRNMTQTELIDQTLATVCRNAANERLTNAVNFVQRLQATHLASFWYSTSTQSCVLIYHFGRLLERTASTTVEVADIRRKLQEYRWTLKVNGEAGAAFMRHALSLIETAEQVVVTTSGDRSVTTSPTTTRDVYQGRRISGLWHQQQSSPNDDTHGPEQQLQANDFDSSADAWNQEWRQNWDNATVTAFDQFGNPFECDPISGGEPFD